jgi:DNA-binding CsgD family transcriptional regulator
MEAFDRQRITHALTAAAIDSARWSEALETAAVCTRSYGALLFPIVGNLPTVCASASMGKAFEVYTRKGWIDHDERHRGIPKLLKTGVATDDDATPLEARKRSPYYQEFLEPCNLRDFAGVRIGRGDLVWCLSLQRTPDQGPFSATELRWLAELSNGLDSVVRISAALGLAKGEAALNAFDFSERAALLLDRSGHVVRVNVAAERLIGEELQILAGRIRCRDPKTTDLLSRSIRTLLWSLDASTTPPIVLQKVSGGKLVIYPMRLAGLTTSPLSAFHAILVISDTDVTCSAATATLREVFDLTAAESCLAVAVANGKDLETFSTERQLSKQTVRNQLKSIFLKTGTNRQAQLAVTLSSLIPKK